MCGIAGFLGLDRTHPVEPTLAAMLDTIRHRGPDDAGQWLDPAHGCGCGMRRLSIVDLAGGHQPMWNEDGQIGVVFNGEIYNHAALREGLRARGHTLVTQSDTEVLVHLYEEHGPEGMLAQLRGMYAFAIVDRQRRQVLLARDPFGQKPLYLREVGGGLAFASEIKALAIPAFGRPARDETRLLDYAAWLALPAPLTHFRGVSKFAPGEWQTRSFAGELRQRGIAPAVRFATNSDTLSDAESGPALDRALDESVNLHLRADVPIGLLLSGGLDSRAIASYAQPLVGGRVASFTAVFGTTDDEHTAARETAAALRTTHEEVALGFEQLRDSLDLVLHHLDEPVGDPAAFAVYHLCRAAAARGVKVLLSGEGADELMGGYTTRYREAREIGRRSAWLRGTLGWCPPPREAFPRDAWPRYLERATRDRATELVCLQIEGLPRNAPSVQGLPPADRGRLKARAETYAHALEFAHPDAATAVQQLNLRWQLPESLLVKADRMSMAASVELRCPFLDLGVARVATRLPASQRIDAAGTTGKVILRRILEQRSPGSADRPKQGFPLPLGRWLRGPLRAEVEPVFRDAGSAVVGLMGRAEADAFWQQFLDGVGSAHLIYALWIYERWRLRQP